MDVDEKLSQSTHNSWTPTIMSHPDSPEYFTLSTVCQYSGDTTILAICEDMDAVMYRLKQCYSSCGDEYRINCYHLTTASDAAEKYNEQLVSRREYQAKEREKEEKVAKYDELKKFSQDTTGFTEEETEQLIEDLDKA